MRRWSTAIAAPVAKPPRAVSGAIRRPGGRDRAPLRDQPRFVEQLVAFEDQLLVPGRAGRPNGEASPSRSSRSRRSASPPLLPAQPPVPPRSGRAAPACRRANPPTGNSGTSCAIRRRPSRPGPPRAPAPDRRRPGPAGPAPRRRRCGRGRRRCRAARHSRGAGWSAARPSAQADFQRAVLGFERARRQRLDAAQRRRMHRRSAGRWIVKTRGSCTLAVTMTAERPIDSATTGRRVAEEPPSRDHRADGSPGRIGISSP